MSAPEFLNPETVHPPGGYSHAVICSGRLLVVSGQIGFDKDRNVVGADDFAEQCRQAFQNLLSVLTAGGAAQADVIRLGIILTDRQYLPQLREIRAQFFPPPLPSSTLMIAGLILPELKIEIEALAQLPG